MYGVDIETGAREGRGSFDDEREDETIDPGVESLELRLVLLCGRSGFELLLALNGDMTPRGRLEGFCDVLDPERGFDLGMFEEIMSKLIRVVIEQ